MIARDFKANLWQLHSKTLQTLDVRLSDTRLPCAVRIQQTVITLWPFFLKIEYNDYFFRFSRTSQFIYSEQKRVSATPLKIKLHWQGFWNAELDMHWVYRLLDMRADSIHTVQSMVCDVWRIRPHKGYTNQTFPHTHTSTWEPNTNNLSNLYIYTRTHNSMNSHTHPTWLGSLHTRIKCAQLQQPEPW